MQTIYAYCRDPRRPFAVMPPLVSLPCKPAKGLPFEDVAPNYKALDAAPQPRAVTQLPQPAVERIVSLFGNCDIHALAAEYNVTTAEISRIWSRHGCRNRKCSTRRPFGCRHG